MVEIAVLGQIETGEALTHLAEIASVPSVDDVFIGPADLSASLGHIGNPAHETVQITLTTAVDQLSARGKSAGILAFNPDDAQRYIDWGHQFVAVGSDLGILDAGIQALAATFK